MNEKIKVIVKRPDEAGHVTWMSNTLKAFQTAVGGHIEVVSVKPGVVVVCNEDGRLIGLEPNCRFLGIDFVGTIIVAGTDGEEFADTELPLAAFKRLCDEVTP